MNENEGTATVTVKLNRASTEVVTVDYATSGIDADGAPGCSALDYMHTKGHEPILHRDIKPANILLEAEGRVWLVDFGLAKAEPVESSSEEIGATKASGSLGYTPLEQWFGQAVPASDIYALGASLYHLVTGTNPLHAFTGKFNLKMIRDLHGQFVPIRKIDGKLPKRLEQIINGSQSPLAGYLYQLILT